MMEEKIMPYQRNAGAVRRFAKAMRFVTWLQSLPNKLTPPPFRLIQIGSAFWHSRALHVATQLDIATVLGDGELDAESIAARVAAHPDALRRLLRLLAAIGVFEETAPHTFRNNKLSTFLRMDNPKNVRALILLHNSDAMSRPWYEHLECGVREGVPPFRLGACRTFRLPASKICRTFSHAWNRPDESFYSSGPRNGLPVTPVSGRVAAE